MKNFIEVMEKIGQTRSIKQAESVSKIMADIDCDVNAFTQMAKHSNDLVCMLMPDDDDEE